MLKYQPKKSVIAFLVLTSAITVSSCSTSQPQEVKESAAASASATASASVEAVDPQAEFASKSASLMAKACDDLDLYRKAWTDANPDPYVWVRPTSYVTRDVFLNSLATAASYDKRWTDALISFNHLELTPSGWIAYDEDEASQGGWWAEEDIAAWNVLKSSCQIARAGS